MWASGLPEHEVQLRGQGVDLLHTWPPGCRASPLPEADAIERDAIAGLRRARGDTREHAGWKDVRGSSANTATTYCLPLTTNSAGASKPGCNRIDVY